MLWVSYIFPPYGGKNGQQGAYLLSELVRRGVDVDVLTIKPCAKFPQTDTSLLRSLPEGIRIHRTSAGLLCPLRYGSGKPASFESRVRNFIALLSNIEWIPIAWHHLRHCHGPYDGIYSQGDPISCHVVAALAKRRFGGRLLLDYGDPYALKPPRRNVSRPRLILQRALERWCLRQADAVGMRVDANGEAYRRVFPFLVHTPFVTLYGGVTQEAYDATAAEQEAQFTMLYTGRLYAHTVGVSRCLEALSLLRAKGRDVRLRFAGTTREELACHAPSELLDLADFLPYQSFDGTMQLQKSATVLVVFAVNYPYAVPSKISEYLAARRPILCIEGDPNIISGLVSRYHRGVSAPVDATEIATTVDSLYDRWRKGTLEKAFHLDNAIPEVSWGHMADTILAALRGPSDQLQVGTPPDRGATSGGPT